MRLPRSTVLAAALLGALSVTAHAAPLSLDEPHVRLVRSFSEAPLDEAPPWRPDLADPADDSTSFYSASTMSSLAFGDTDGERLSSAIDKLYADNMPTMADTATLALCAVGVGAVVWGLRRHHLRRD